MVKLSRRKANLTITKEVTFDCAHMLSGHEGLCANLHGHTYRVQVSVSGVPIKKGPSMGMLIDFKDLKSMIQKIIIDQCDHAVIFSSYHLRNAAEETLYDWAFQNKMRLFIMPERTTAEEMAQFFRAEFLRAFFAHSEFDNIRDVSIKLWETPTSFVEAT